MATYTARSVERLLRNYLDIICTLEGNCQQVPDTYTIHKKPPRNMARQPLGQTTTGDPWPFMETKHARVPTDGKTKARFLEELHCAAIDIETHFHALSSDDKNLILKYHILQSHRLDELMQEYGLSSRGSMQQRISRAVQRLVNLMEK